MLLKAGALSLALLLASRLLGLLRESAQAAAFGSSGMADLVVLMLTLPDWLAGVMASGALAYVLLPAWAGQPAAQVAAGQRRVARGLLALGLVLTVVMVVGRDPLQRWLAAGLPAMLNVTAAQAMIWAALAVPAALLAALWTTRLQHERDFAGMYAANLVVNGVLIAALAAAAMAGGNAVSVVGTGLLLAMVARLLWLYWRQRRIVAQQAPTAIAPAALVPAPLPVWLWAALSAGLPLALPFVARSVASQGGEGALAVFNYAWKLVELPLILAIQLVATLSFPRIAQALSASAAHPHDGAADPAVRAGFALAWVLACAAAAALLVGAPALAQFLFGWGRMDAPALARVAQWGSAGAWGLLPQALIAVSLTVLASRQRMGAAVLAYALALGLLLLAASQGVSDGVHLMQLLNGLLLGIAAVTVVAMGPAWRRWLPWRSMAMALAALVVVAALGGWVAPLAGSMVSALMLAATCAVAVLGLSVLGSAELRAALRR